MTIYRRHDLPPQPDIEVPLLWFIAQNSGSVRVSDYREKIRSFLAGMFCVSEDLLAEETTWGDNRWWNHIRHVVRMLRDKGELEPVVGTGKGQSGRNYWSIAK